jgi:hypothetical protein
MVNDNNQKLQNLARLGFVGSVARVEVWERYGVGRQ